MSDPLIDTDSVSVTALHSSRLRCPADDLRDRANELMGRDILDLDLYDVCELIRDMAEQLSRVQLAGTDEWERRDRAQS